MTEPYYSISKLGELLLVRQTGDWTLVKDIEYLCALGEHFTSLKQSRFAVFVDMRGWIVPESVKSTPIKEFLTLDRRSQIAECWLCDDFKMSEYILPHFANVSFTLERVTDKHIAESWVNPYLKNDQDKEQFTTWLNSKR